MSILILLVAALSLAYIFSELCKHINVPRVVGQIFAGIVIGIFSKDLLIPSTLETFSLLSDVGIVLLFFFTGFEVNLKEFQKHFKNTVTISAFNTAIPFLAGFLLTLWLGYGLTVAILVGICLAVSSTSISLDFLEEFGLLKSKIGNLIITTGAVDDLLELIFTTIILAFLQISIGNGTVTSLFIGMLAFIGIATLARFLIIPFALNVVQKEHSASGLFMIALILTMAMASISDYLGLGSLIGALIAGVLIRHSIMQEKTRRPWETHEISQTIHTVSFGFLVPIFFVWVGINTDITAVFSNPFLVFALSAIAIGGTVIGTALAVLVNKGNWEEGILVGWGVTAKGDVELVIATLALKNGLIAKDIYTALILMAFITTLVAPIVFRRMIMDKMVRKNLKAGLKVS
ncbi:cation:proton antiporter [Candidatus Micrarchaeota archaeon]|nr:cation:proton antiporter [Candidatus Micrarchaeota archaeon]